MPISQDGLATRTPVKNGDIFAQTGCIHGTEFAIIDDKDYSKQIAFTAASQATQTTTTLAAGATSANITLTLPAATGTLATTSQLGINQLTGDVTAGPGSSSQAATIAANAVTNAKMATMAGNTVKANVTGSTATPTDVSAVSTPSTASAFVIRNSAGYISDIDPSLQTYVYDDFIQGGTPPAGLTANTSGSNAKSVIRSTASTSANPGVWSLRTGTTTTGNANLFGSNIDQVFSPVGNGTFQWEALVQIPVLSNGTDRFSIVAGLTIDPYNANVSPAEAIYFSYADNSNSGKFKFQCVTSSTGTSIDTGTAAVGGVWYKLGFIINAAGTSVQAYFNNVAVGAAITTNIPTGNIMLGFVNAKTVGTTDREFYIDYYKMTKTFTTAR